MFRSLLLAFCASSLSAAAAPTCELTVPQVKTFLSQDFDTFDQKPTGWRSLYDASAPCNLTIAFLVDSYHLTHQTKLLPWQARISYWHAGQSYAYLGLTELAVARFEKSFDPDEGAAPEFHWNAYVRASLAFLKKDRAALEKAAQEFTTVSPLEKGNFAIVQRFLRCFQESYLDVYSGTGACP